jgi:hypothetical protein
VNPGQAEQLAAAVRELRAQVAAQADEIAALRARVAELDAPTAPEPTVASPHAPELSTSEASTGRRGFLALAGSAAAAAAVAFGADAAPAAAVNLQDVQLAATNPTTPGVVASTTHLDYSPANAGQVDYLRVSDENGEVPGIDPFYARYLPAAVAGHARTTPDRVLTGVTGLSEVESGNGVLGIATGSGGSYGVWGISETGNGVVGRSTSGYDFFADGAGRIGLSAHVFVGPPAAGTYTASDLVRDSQGALWTCVVSGAPGVWRKLAGPTTAGAFHAITPTRVFDSRAPRPAPGPIVTGEPRTLTVADGRDPISGKVTVPELVPAGATAIACNITVTDTVGAGFAVVNPGDNASVGASTINWSHSAQTLANGIIVGIDDARRVTVVVGGGGYTDLVVDVTGYFR